MSIEAITAALYCSQSKAAAKLVLVAIADGISRGTDCWYAYIDEIAEVAGYSHRFTSTQITKLVGAGELIVQQVGGKRCNYYIPLLPGEEGYEPTQCKDNHDCNGWHTPLSIGRTETARKNRKARQQEAKKKQAHRNDSSQVQEFLGTGAQENEPDIGTIDPGHRNDSSQDKGTIDPKSRNDSSYVVLIEDISGYIPGLDTGRDPDAHPREASPSSQKNLETGKPAETSSPPAPPPPPGKEERAIWGAVQRHMADRGVNYGQLTVMKGAHLYRLGRGMWRVYVPRGFDTSKFRARYEDLIVDALSVQQRAGNQIVEFAS